MADIMAGAVGFHIMKKDLLAEKAAVRRQQRSNRLDFLDENRKMVHTATKSMGCPAAEPTMCRGNVLYRVIRCRKGKKVGSKMSGSGLGRPAILREWVKDAFI